jgi:hypothetical protein
MADDAPDIFDELEQLYRTYEGSTNVPGESVVNDLYKPALEPLQIKSHRHFGVYKDLTDIDRRIVVEIDVKGRMHQEIAKGLGLTTATVSGKYYRARIKILRDYVENAAWIEKHGIDVDAWHEEEVA